MGDTRSFRYLAYTQAGVLTEGRIEAETVEQVHDVLWERGLTPFETHDDQRSASRRWSRGTLLAPRKPSARDIAAFVRELATLIEAGVPLDDTLRIMVDHSGQVRMRPVVTGLLQSVLDGAHLSDAMARHRESFQNDTISMVRAGEISGDLVRVLTELADLLERRQQLVAKTTSALVYPCILIVMALVSITIVMAVLVPSLAPIFAESGRPLPGMIAFILWVQQGWPWLAAIVALMVAASSAARGYVKRSTNARLAAHRLLLKLPLAGVVSVEQNLARFARTLGSLLRAGVPMLAAFASARAVVQNAHIASGLEASLEQIRDGQNLGRALSGRDGIPPVALRMIAVGEETARLGHMLIRIALLFEQQSQRRIERLMTMLTPALTVGIAGLIGLLIFTVMNAILSINELAAR
ncbi:type II secretion system F family protein [Bradyrhizobium sp. WD16]|uniref:type II secretion system F family protein n=1 Tax=Bradyrhizobium sp. WD16 TaxID=1521768 RepID=UPI0021115E3F|nr:type II secretion system F family protein [Bradyrhizobium sp. WD16]UTD26548.1 hypothetical protein DB459_06050 [Bradyrhizobium sp. WD16]